MRKHKTAFGYALALHLRSVTTVACMKHDMSSDSETAAINAPVEPQLAVEGAHLNIVGEQQQQLAEDVNIANERQEAIDLSGLGHDNSLPPASSGTSSDENSDRDGRRSSRRSERRGGTRGGGGGAFARSSPELAARIQLSKRMYPASRRRATSPKPSRKTHFVAQDALARPASTCFEAPPEADMSTHPCHTHMEPVFKDVVQSLHQTGKLKKIMEAVVNHHNNMEDRHPFQAAFDIQSMLEPVQMAHIHELITAKVGTGLYDCFQTNMLI
ncbi:hypothetical protein FA10DRAFT_260448 [Acaromyces ingoldii]|uniref:Uncharacterized protein n=1 Tax=Acaromyces ingoldii TaxID=215250 RepID=A0A316YRL7_9BASI|nr:hypothetical protein FA10DRAFT_260448 [Acaromyces ingoldii]PWN90653.1 hypothetical protein FA10DRAFT_260448 [Acaromyces ingoldii]